MCLVRLLLRLMHGLCSMPTASILSRCHFSRSFARQLKIRFAGSSDNIGAMQLQLEGVSEVDLGAARFSLPRAAAMESGPLRPSHLSLSTGARFVRREGGRGHERGEGILPARSVGWGGKILDLGRLQASTLKWS